MQPIEAVLNYSVFTDRWPASGRAQAAYISLYRCWNSLWSSTFHELEGIKDHRSDDFDRLNEITGIWRGQEVVGVFGFHWYRMDLPSHMQHSYFKAFPTAAIEQLVDLNAKMVMSMGNLAVVPDWRKRENGIIAEVLVGLACKRFLQSDADYLIAYTRNDRKVNHLGYRHGARCLVANHTEHNVPVDIIAISRDEVVVAQDSKVHELVEEIWRRREIFGAFQHGVRPLLGPRLQVA